MFGCQVFDPQMAVLDNIHLKIVNTCLFYGAPSLHAIKI